MWVDRWAKVYPTKFGRPGLKTLALRAIYETGQSQSYQSSFLDFVHQSTWKGAEPTLVNILYPTSSLVFLYVGEPSGRKDNADNRGL